MAYSGTISLTSFNANRVVDTAYRRCRLPAQSITSEMQQYALDALYLLLSDLANPRTLSWCIEQIILPMYQGQPAVTLPLGTVDVLNANYRTLQALSPTSESQVGNTYEIAYDGDQTVGTIGVKFDGAGVALAVQTSPDGLSWTSTAFTVTAAGDGEWSWIDIVPSISTAHLRLFSADAWTADVVSVGNTPTEIPLGMLNKDIYTAQTNKVFQGRPTTGWFQRDLAQPVINLWPAPDAAAELAQLVVWRQRHIMDIANLRQDLEVPQRWLDAVIWMLAYKVALETPSVDMNVIPLLKAQADESKMRAYDGDGDGSPTYIMPMISGYTR